MPTTLHDLLARGARPEWFEAVALVQALSERLLENGPGADLHVPDPPDIVLGEDGRVETTGTGPARQSPVCRLGQLMTALVGDRAIPPALRLLALTAEAAEPRFGSVREFSKALDFYERPGRQTILADLYRRYVQLPEGTPAEVPALRAEPTAPPRAARPAASYLTRRRIALGCAALLVAALAGSLWWGHRTRASWFTHGWQRASAGFDTAWNASARLVRSGTTAVGEALNLQAPRDAQAQGEPAGPAAPAPSPPRPLAASPAAARPPAAGTAQAAPAARLPQPEPGEGVAPVPEATSAPAAVPPPVPATAPPVPATAPPAPVPSPGPAPRAEPEDQTIYSRDNREVIPPALVLPRLPSEPTSGIPLLSVPVLEAVVSATGAVETARIVTPTPDVAAAMMVSAAKNWRFLPAMRDGHPVRYRMLIRLTNR